MWFKDFQEFQFFLQGIFWPVLFITIGFMLATVTGEYWKCSRQKNNNKNGDKKNQKHE